MKPLIRLFALFSLLTLTGEADVIGSHDTVKWVDGEDPTLTCDLKKPFNVTTLSVLWERNGTIVHLYRSKADYLVKQDKNFLGRTSLFPDELAKGTFSLSLTNVTELDAGNYTCKGRVKDLSGKGLVRQCNVTLIVERKQSKGNLTNSPRIEDNKDTVISLSVIIPIVIVIVIVIVIGIGIYIWNKHIKKEPALEPQNDPTPEPAPEAGPAPEPAPAPLPAPEAGPAPEPAPAPLPAPAPEPAQEPAPEPEPEPEKMPEHDPRPSPRWRGYTRQKSKETDNPEEIPLMNKGSTSDTSD